MKNSIKELNEREIREVSGGGDALGALIYAIGLGGIWSGLYLYEKIIGNRIKKNVEINL